MQLQTTVTPARPAVLRKVTYSGQVGDINVASGQSLRVESSPGGEEILNAVVPEGKRWVAHVKVDIQEFDV